MKRLLALFFGVLMSVLLLAPSASAAGESITVQYLVDGDVYTTTSYASGKTIPLENVPPSPLEVDRCFVGWYLNGVPFDFENTVLTAELAPSNTITLEASYNPSHGEWEYKVTREATCTKPGVKAKICPDCGYREDSSIELAAHQLSYVEEVKSTCLTHGRAAHYECSVCGAAYRDEEGGFDVGEEALELPLGAHELVPVAEVPSDCKTLGTKAHYRCSVCQKRFLNEDGTGEITSDDELRLTEFGAHDFVPVEEIPSDCKTLGTRAHFRCSVCQQCFADEEGTGEPLTEEDLRLTEYGPHRLDSVAERPSDCQTLGIKAHFECSVCQKCFLDESGTGEGLTEEELRLTEYGPHELELVPEVPSDCQTLGTGAHYVCSVCEKLFSAANGTEEITDAETLRLSDYGEHVLTQVPEHPASCTESGTKAYYVCEACGKQYEDAGGTKEHQNPETVAPLGHHLQKIEAVNSTCVQAGHSECYQCSRCEKLFRDEEGTAETTMEALALPLARHQLTAVPETPATCTEGGNRLHYFCPDCKQLFSDVNGTPASEETVRIAALGHDYIAVEAEPAQSCLVSGHRKYYRCSRCGMLFDEEFQVLSSLDEIAIPGQHLMALIPAVPASCTEDGSIEHYRCSACKRLFLDKAGTQEIFSTVVKAHHNLKKIDAKDPTCTSAGNTVYYKCEDCGLLFSDAEAKTETTESAVLLAAKGHDFKNGVCTRCGAVAENFVAQIIKGNNGTAYYGYGYSFTLNTDYETVKDRVVVKINGWQLADSSFTVTKGSTVVTLTVDCIRSLAAGTYAVAIETPQGTATGMFRISTSPKTGDVSDTGLWFAVALASAAGIVGIAGYGFKRKKQT